MNNDNNDNNNDNNDNISSFSDVSPFSNVPSNFSDFSSPLITTPSRGLVDTTQEQSSSSAIRNLNFDEFLNPATIQANSNVINENDGDEGKKKFN